VLTALMAADVLTMSRDSFGRLRTPFCNMGVCFECLVEVADSEDVWSRVRACLTPVRAGLRVVVPEGR
jgi:sarcosine oxidase subunit alpha